MMWGALEAHEFGEVLKLLRSSQCVRNISLMGMVGSPTELTVGCVLPLDVGAAVGFQILGDRAVADPGLELTILASLEGE